MLDKFTQFIERHLAGPMENWGVNGIYGRSAMGSSLLCH